MADGNEGEKEEKDGKYFSTDQEILRCKEPGLLKDRLCKGLRLRVVIGKANGKLRKVWEYRYRTRVEQKLRQLKLGVYPTITLEKARERWREEKVIRDDPKRGDPREERKRAAKEVKEKREEEKLHQYSVRELCEHYLTEHIDKHRKHSAEPWRMMKNDVFNHSIAKRPAIEVKRSEIHDLIQGIIQRGAGRIAQMLRRELQAAFEHAVTAGRLPDDHPNPCIKVKAPPQVRRTRAFSVQELEKFLAWLPTAKVSRTVREAMMLELLTSARQGEIVAMEWKHVDLQRGIWTMPKTKNKTRHEAMLSRQALEIIKGRKGLHLHYVFPRPDEKKHVTSKAIGIQQYAAKGTLKIDDWTVHDLRRSALTGLARIGCSRPVQNRISNHADSSIAAIYDVHDYDALAREWSQKWADELDKLKANKK
jgi:integrase